MLKNIKRRDALKAVAAFGGIFMLEGVSTAQITTGRRRLASGWLYQGLPCAIHTQGSILLLINEIGSVGSAVWTGSSTFTVLGGSGWDAGLTAQITNRGSTINWSNGTVWTAGRELRRPQNLSGGWHDAGAPSA